MTGNLHEDEFTFLIVSRPVLHRMINVSDKPCRENQKKQFVFSNFFPKIAPFRRLCKKKKYCTAEHCTDYNTAHAHCMLDT